MSAYTDFEQGQTTRALARNLIRERLARLAGVAQRKRGYREREAAFIASLKRGAKTDAAGNPRETFDAAHLERVRQARNLLENAAGEAVRR